MNVLINQLRNDQVLNDVFSITEHKCFNPGITTLILMHEMIKMELTIDLDYDTGTLIKIDDVLIQYSSTNHFSTTQQLKSLIKTQLQKRGII